MTGDRRKIVYVAMCADMLHVGHLNVLHRASRYGEVIVGLLTDSAIASYKSRPFLKYQQRKNLLLRIDEIHRIIPQKTLNYESNLNRLRPDYVVHGDDWKQGVQKSVRAHVIEILKKWNGQLIEIPYTSHTSSTHLKQLLKLNEINFHTKI